MYSYLRFYFQSVYFLIIHPPTLYHCSSVFLHFSSPLFFRFVFPNLYFHLFLLGSHFPFITSNLSSSFSFLSYQSSSSLLFYLFRFISPRLFLSLRLSPSLIISARSLSRHLSSSTFYLCLSLQLSLPFDRSPSIIPSLSIF